MTTTLQLLRNPKFRLGSKLKVVAPDVPTALLAFAVSSSSITLTWTNGVKSQDGISIERSLDGLTNWAQITTVTSGATYTDTGLTANYYFYRIRAYKAVNYSDYTAVVSNEEPLIILASSVITYDYADLATITTQNNKIIKWADKNESERDIAQPYGPNGSLCPEWTDQGVLFDGGTDQLLVAFDTINQPIVVYLLIKIVTWASGRCIFEGGPADSILMLMGTTTPDIRLRAGSWGTMNSNLAVGEWAVVRATFNGANSKLQVDDTTAITGNWGTWGMNGFSLGARYVIGVCSNILVRQVIIVPTTDGETDIYQYLQKKKAAVDIITDAILTESGEFAILTEDGDYSIQTNFL